MKSDEIKVFSKKDVTDAVMAQAEKAAAYRELPARSALHLRLLAEEMMGLMRAVSDDVEGVFWIESEGEHFELHLDVKTQMDGTRRKRLLSSSTSGKNEANRGFTGKLRAFFETMEERPWYVTVPLDSMDTDMIWTMSTYQQMLQQSVLLQEDGAAEAWDELEKSVLAHLADDIRIGIRGNNVEMTVLKDF